MSPHRVVRSTLARPIVLAWVCSFLVQTAAQGAEPECVPPAPSCLEDLAQLSWPELEELYRHASVGAIPEGFLCGRAIYCPDAAFARLRTRVSRTLWHGKVFRCEDGTLVNQWCGIQAIKAVVCHGSSWLDGQPAIVMNYQPTSFVWRKVRDEMREVAPGLFLGIMYLRHCPEPRFKMFFALECGPSCPEPCQGSCCPDN